MSLTPGFWGAIGSGAAVLTAVITGFAATRKKIAEVHLLVNSALDTKIARIVQLAETLGRAGVAVPPAPAAAPVTSPGPPPPSPRPAPPAGG